MKASDIARLVGEAVKLRFSLNQGKRHAANLGHRMVEAQRRMDDPRLCIGSRDPFRERHDLESHGHAAWSETWRQVPMPGTGHVASRPRVGGWNSRIG